uniref:Uncharacterized protein n=1 Tax=Picea sitchensis TaxID=3332 RepID=D5AC38_PICSI|nr:unknown [Picea sitchensis]
MLFYIVDRNFLPFYVHIVVCSILMSHKPFRISGGLI